MSDTTNNTNNPSMVDGDNSVVVDTSCAIEREEEDMMMLLTSVNVINNEITESDRNHLLHLDQSYSNLKNNNKTTIVEEPDHRPSAHTTTEAERNLMNPSSSNLYRLILSGGPCSGKTTALARIFSYLRERGFEVITFPEAFTMLASNGMSFDLFSTEGMAYIIQGTVMDIQMTMEDGVQRILKARGQPGVMLCDRGIMDGSVYISDIDFRKLLMERKTDIVQVRDNRYDAVFHLVTAADGAEKFYTLENNKARTETIEEARLLDQKTQKAWLGHPHFYVIDNSTDFEGKMSRLVDTISKIVGLPSNLKRRSAKFLLGSKPNTSTFPPDIDYHEFEVEKVYMQQNSNHADSYSFIRRRTSVDKNGNLVGSVYQLTQAQRTGDELVEQKRIISRREYQAAYLTRDRARNVVRQRRISFLYSKQSFTIHIYQEPKLGLCILHAQVEAPADGGEPEVTLPPFLDVERRIEDTKEDQEKFGAYSLSLM